MANPANQPISEKLLKWHFLIYAWNLEFFGPHGFIWGAVVWLYQKNVQVFFLGFLWIPCNAWRQNLRVQTGKISVWTWGLSINSLHHQHVKTSKVILNRISCFILYIDFLLIQLSYLLNITNRCQAFAVMIDLLFDLQMWLCMSKKC